MIKFELISRLRAAFLLATLKARLPVSHQPDIVQSSLHVRFSGVLRKSDFSPLTTACDPTRDIRCTSREAFDAGFSPYTIYSSYS